MFVGSIAAPIRSVVSEIARSWKGCDVYVGCSGNFTIEHIVAGYDPRALHGNDVSLYSCAIGKWLCGGELSVRVKDDEFAWMGQFLRTPADTAATLALCLEYLGFASKQDRPFFKRMWSAAVRGWKALHTATVERMAKVAAEIRLTTFTPGDVVRFATEAPVDSAFICFPPTYEKGYERLYKPLAKVFEWDEPDYEVFDEGAMKRLVDAMTAKLHWVLSWDKAIEGLDDYLVARCQATPRAHPVNVYASSGRSRLSLGRQRIDPVRVPRVENEIGDRIELVELDQGEFNWLRSQYLGRNIVPAAAQYRFAVLIDGRIAGAMAFSSPTVLGGDWCDAYMMSDFAVAPTSFPRLSKLISASALSLEVAQYLSQRMAKLVQVIGTTAFTDKPVSMKYRGLFHLEGRKEGKLNYTGRAGSRTLNQTLQWWKQKYQASTSN